MTDRFAPVFIDIDTGKKVIYGNSLNEDFNSYRIEIDEPSSQWGIEHGLGTKSIMVKVYFHISGTSPVQYEEVIPESIILQSDNLVEINFDEPQVGVVHMLIWGLAP